MPNLYIVLYCKANPKVKYYKNFFRSNPDESVVKILILESFEIQIICTVPSIRIHFVKFKCLHKAKPRMTYGYKYRNNKDSFQKAPSSLNYKQVGACTDLKL
jgi:hypothetical protein